MGLNDRALGAHNVIPMSTGKSARRVARLPNGTMSHSLANIQSTKRLVKKMRPIEEKRSEPHEYRNSNNAVEFRYTCDWCTLPHTAAIHHF